MAKRKAPATLDTVQNAVLAHQTVLGHLGPLLARIESLLGVLPMTLQQLMDKVNGVGALVQQMADEIRTLQAAVGTGGIQPAELDQLGAQLDAAETVGHAALNAPPPPPPPGPEAAPFNAPGETGAPTPPPGPPPAQQSALDQARALLTRHGGQQQQPPPGPQPLRPVPGRR